MEKSLSAYYEIKIAFEVFQNCTSKEVDIFSQTSTGKNPDIFVKLAEKDLYIELTGLNQRDSEKKIVMIIEGTSRAFLERSTTRGFLMLILLDTLVFKIDGSGIFDTEKTIEYLGKYYDRLALNELAGSNIHVNFKENYLDLVITNNGNINKKPVRIYLETSINNDEQLSDSKIRLIFPEDKKFDAFEVIQIWADKVLLYDYLNSPFNNTVPYPQEDNSCVMINSIEWTTDNFREQQSQKFKTSEIVKKAFLSQIERTLRKNKLAIKQNEIDKPFIIAIRAYEWRFEYENEYRDLAIIRDVIQELLKNENDVSGVIIFTNNIYSGKYIENPRELNRSKSYKTGIRKIWNNCLSS